MLEGVVERVMPYGIFLKLDSGASGLIPNSEMGTPKGSNHSRMFPPGTRMQVVVIDSDKQTGKVSLSRGAVSEKQAQDDFKKYVVTLRAAGRTTTARRASAASASFCRGTCRIRSRYSRKEAPFRPPAGARRAALVYPPHQFIDPVPGRYEAVYGVRLIGIADGDPDDHVLVLSDVERVFDLVFIGCYQTRWGTWRAPCPGRQAPDSRAGPRYPPGGPARRRYRCR